MILCKYNISSKNRNFCFAAVILFILFILFIIYAAIYAFQFLYKGKIKGGTERNLRISGVKKHLRHLSDVPVSRN